MRALALALLVTAGCSFIQVRGTPRVPDSPYDTACASYEAPVADSVFAAAALGVSAYAVASCDGGSGFDCLDDAMVAGMLIPASIVLAASATYGYIQKSRCERRAPHGAAVARVSASSS